MDEERLREMETRHERARPPGAFTTTENAAQLWFRDLPELIAEVRRLRGALVECDQQLAIFKAKAASLDPNDEPIPWEEAKRQLRERGPHGAK